MQNQTPNVRYFPENILSDRKRLSAFTEQWYSGQLTALEEPSLFEASRDKTTESYRFLWLRSFHHPVSVRLDILGDGDGVLTTKMAGGAGGYVPGKLLLNEQTKFTKQQASGFLAQLQFLKVWAEPTLEERDGLDGAQWIFEAAKGGVYHVVDRWSPKEGPIHTIGLKMMLKMANLKLLYEEVY